MPRLFFISKEGGKVNEGRGRNTQQKGSKKSIKTSTSIIMGNKASEEQAPEIFSFF